MRSTTARDETKQLAFAEKAAADFAAHPDHATFGDCEPGSFLAIRWGMGGDCVLVLKLDEFHEPTNYQQLVRKGEVQS